MNEAKYTQILADYKSLKELAIDYGRLHFSLDASRYDTRVSNISFGAKTVTIVWQWYGKYGYVDSGEFSVPVAVLCNRDSWRDYIIAEIHAIKEEDDRIEKAEQDARRAANIAAAKKLLQSVGEL